ALARSTATLRRAAAARRASLATSSSAVFLPVAAAPSLPLDPRLRPADRWGRRTDSRRSTIVATAHRPRSARTANTPADRGRFVASQPSAACLPDGARNRPAPRAHRIPIRLPRRRRVACATPGPACRPAVALRSLPRLLPRRLRPLPARSVPAVLRQRAGRPPRPAAHAPDDGTALRLPGSETGTGARYSGRCPDG